MVCPLTNLLRLNNKFAVKCAFWSDQMQTPAELLQRALLVLLVSSGFVVDRISGGLEVRAYTTNSVACSSAESEGTESEREENLLQQVGILS